MQHDISFLHTNRVHIPTFTKLINKMAPHLSVNHIVEAGLLEQARKDGMNIQLSTRIQNVMQAAASTGARVVVCTCSTIGAAAELAGNGQKFTAMRIDRPMTIQALKTGARILLAATLQSTLAPTKELVADSATKLGIPENTYHTELLHIRQAWPYFEAGNKARYYQSIQNSLMASWKEFDVIVLAQASMSGVHSLCDDIKIPLLSSPTSGVQTAIEAFAQYQKIRK